MGHGNTYQLANQRQVLRLKSTAFHRGAAQLRPVQKLILLLQGNLLVEGTSEVHVGVAIIYTVMETRLTLIGVCVIRVDRNIITLPDKQLMKQNKNN